MHIKQLPKLQTHHSQIESSIDEGRSVVVDIVEHALGNLQHTLVDNILVGSSREWPLASRNPKEAPCSKHSLDAKLDPLKALGQVVRKLLLGGAHKRGVRHGIASFGLGFVFVEFGFALSTIKT